MKKDSFKFKFKKKQLNKEKAEEKKETLKVEENAVEEKKAIVVVPRIENKETIKAKEILNDSEIIDKAYQAVREIKTSRIPGSSDERNTANYLLNKTEEILGKKGALEPFYVSWFSHNFGLMIIGAMFLIALITFAFSPLTALIFYMVAVVILGNRIFSKKDIFKGITKKDISFNVVSELDAKSKTENTLIITSNYSSSKNWLLNRFFNINSKALLISMIVYVLILFISLICLSAGIDNVGLQAFVGLLLSVLAIGCFAFYSFDKGNLNIRNGLGGVALSLMTVDYLNNHPKLVGDNTKVVLALIGGGTDGANGTKAFIKEHFKNNNDYPNAKVISFETITDDQAIISNDSKSTLTNMAYDRLCKDPVAKQKGIIKGYGTTLFSQVGVDSIAIGENQKIIKTDVNTIKDNKELSVEELTKKLYLYLPVVTDVLNKFNNK